MYAGLQRAVGATAVDDAMLAAGVPDGRPERLPGEPRTRSSTDDVTWARIDARSTRVAADAARGRLCATAVGASRPPPLSSGGRHRGRGPARRPARRQRPAVGRTAIRIFDWGDAVVAHPFTTLTVTLQVDRPPRRPGCLDGPGVRSASRRLRRGLVGRRPHGTAVVRDRSPLASALGCIGEVAAWERR